MKPNHEIVLRWLEKTCQEIEFSDGYVYSLIDDTLWCRVNLETIGIETEQSDDILWYRSDMALNDFIGFCKALSDKQIAMMCADLALQSYKRSESKIR